MESVNNGCTHCGSPTYEEGYVNNFCRECRREMSRYPIAPWVKWMAAGVAALFFISLFNMPKALKASMAYNKGSRLLEEHKYVSAEKAFLEILQQYPSDFKMNANYAIAAFHNGHFEITDSVLKQWQGKPIEDEEMLNKVNQLMELPQYYNLSDDSIYTQLEDAADTKERIAIMNTYHLTHKEEIAAKLYLATYYSKDSNYTAVISLCEEIRKLKPDIVYAHPMLGTAYCQQKQYDKALQVSDQLLAQNAESINGLLLKAKVMLKQKQDRKALLFAQQAYDYDPTGTNAISLLGLAAHFNGDKKLFADMQKQLTALADSADVAWFNGVIENKISYRD